MFGAILPALLGSAAMRAGLPAIAGRFSTSKVISSMKMGFGYTTASYLQYGFLNETWDPLGVQPKWDNRGGPLKSKLPFRKRKKMAYYRRYRRYRPYRRRRYFRRYRRYY